MTRLPTNRVERIGRRTFLKTGTAVAVGSVVTGNAGADEGSSVSNFHPGDSVAVGDGTVTAYATTGSTNAVTTVGVHIDGAALNAFDDEEVATPLALPSETVAGEDIDRHQFSFAKFEYLPTGHWPEGVYDVPHLDVEFHMLDRPTVEGIESGPANYAIPEPQLPEGHVRPPAVDTDDDGEPDAPLVEAERGEPIGNPNAPEFEEGGQFTHTHVYGAYDPDGDGVGRLTLFEPMIAVEFAAGVDAVVTAELRTPAEFFTADEYPTAYALQPTGDGGVYLYLDDFEAFSGPSE
ncbi:hypothetical protein M0R89_14480 [Halorussus limi]|uniref:Uncharacterized protein n=1 Tax=Halorussus limi TaxID=2938695 RepID=A0A8U0HRZ6_9EURY|nr:hypothetical protein [Halorussus limi]UPV73740.1 hypothetical protein M0R89_14480 [Halorussus limi]